MCIWDLIMIVLTAVLGGGDGDPSELVAYLIALAIGA